MSCCLEKCLPSLTSYELMFGEVYPSLSQVLWVSVWRSVCPCLTSHELMLGEVSVPVSGLMSCCLEKCPFQHLVLWPAVWRSVSSSISSYYLLFGELSAPASRLIACRRSVRTCLTSYELLFEEVSPPVLLLMSCCLEKYPPLSYVLWDAVWMEKCPPLSFVLWAAVWRSVHPFLTSCELLYGKVSAPVLRLMSCCMEKCPPQSLVQIDVVSSSLSWSPESAALSDGHPIVSSAIQSHDRVFNLQEWGEHHWNEAGIRPACGWNKAGIRLVWTINYEDQHADRFNFEPFILLSISVVLDADKI